MPKISIVHIHSFLFYCLRMELIEQYNAADNLCHYKHQETSMFTKSYTSLA